MKHQSTETKGTTWFRFRTLAVATTALVMVVTIGLFLWLAPFYKLAKQWEVAQASRNIIAMEELYCWDGVDAEMRQRMHLLFLQEFEHPVKNVRVLRWRDVGSDERWRSNLEPVAQLNVTFNNAEHFQVSFIIGRTAKDGCKLAIMVPKP